MTHAALTPDIKVRSGLVSLVVNQFSMAASNDRGACCAQLALWTAGIVVCTLLVNAPLMPLILRWTRLNEISPVKLRMRGKAARALLRYTGTAIEDLQHDEDEMLRGELCHSPDVLRIFLAPC